MSGVRESVAIGTRLSIRSAVLGEDRPLLVYLPESHESSSFRYPVLYVLDGSSDFLHASAIVEFLSRTDQIPEMIVVGIENTNRSRDLTPPSEDAEETAFWNQVGGADNFREFLRSELIPFIDDRYRTEPYRILRGQSFGGLLALHDLLSDTPTFSAYITSSAAAGWNYGELMDKGSTVLEDHVGTPLYLSAGGRDNPAVVRDVEAFGRILGEHASEDLRWLYELFPDEGHYSLDMLSTHNGLRWLYSDWQVPDSVAALADLSAFEQHYARLSRDFGYEIKIPMKSVIRLGNQLLRAQRFEEGVAVHRANLQLYPQQPESYWHVGDALMLSNRSGEARPYFEQALERATALNVPLDSYRESLAELTP